MSQINDLQKIRRTKFDLSVLNALYQLGDAAAMLQYGNVTTANHDNVIKFTIKLGKLTEKICLENSIEPLITAMKESDEAINLSPNNSALTPWSFALSAMAGHLLQNQIVKERGRG